jgi:hypothetical protein
VDYVRNFALIPLLIGGFLSDAWPQSKHCAARITLTSISDRAVVPSNWSFPVIEWDDLDSNAKTYQLNVWSERRRLSINVTGVRYCFKDSSFIPFLRNREVRFSVTRKAGESFVSSDTIAVIVDTIRFTDRIVYRLVEPLFIEEQDGLLETAAIESNSPRRWDAARKTCIGCHAFSESCAAFNARRGSVRQLLTATPTNGGDVLQNADIGEFSFLSVNKPGNKIAVVAGARSMIDKKATYDEPFDMTYNAGDIAIFDLYSGRLVSLPGASGAGFVEDMPVWSPDCASILFCRYVPNPGVNGLKPMTLMQVPFNEGKGGEARRVLENQPSAYCYFPKWSPDGKYISFVSGDASRGYFARNSSEIWLYAPKIKLLRKLKLNIPGTMNSWHTWSSDGRWIVFASKRGKNRLTAAYCARIEADGADHPAFRIAFNSGMKINLPYLIPAGASALTGRDFGKIVESVFHNRLEGL